MPSWFEEICSLLRASQADLNYAGVASQIEGMRQTLHARAMWHHPFGTQQGAWTLTRCDSKDVGSRQKPDVVSRRKPLHQGELRNHLPAHRLPRLEPLGSSSHGTGE